MRSLPQPSLAAALPEPVWPPGAEALRREVRSFLDEELAAGTFEPQVDVWFSSCSPELSRKLGARGWIGMTWPERYGGADRSALERLVVVEELLAAGAPVGAHWAADRQVGPTLLRYGTDQQRKRHLPAIARGERYFAIGLSEPDSGSDLASVRTRAVPEAGGGLRVTGTKVWTSNAHVCHYLVALVRTGPETEDRHDGLTQVIIDLQAPGVTVRPIRMMTGEHDFNEVHLDEVHVGPEDVIGTVGDGWEQVSSELAFERSGPERFLSTVPLVMELLRRVPDACDGETATLVGGLASELWSLRQLSVGVAAALDAGHVPDVAASVVKDLGTRFEQHSVEVVRTLLVGGPPPEAVRRLLDRAVTRAPSFTLRGGTNEVLRTVVARGLGL